MMDESSCPMSAGALKSANTVSFDQHAPAHVEHWPAVYRDLRDRCPRAWSKEHGGFWIATRYNDIISVSRSLSDVSAHQGMNPETGDLMLGTAIPGIPGTRSVPNETDSPEWDGVRGFLNKWFSPPAVARWTGRAVEISREIVARAAARGECDLVDDIASPLPGMLTTEIFGFPTEEWDRFACPIHTLVATPSNSPAFAEASEQLGLFHERVDEEVAIRRAEPRDDLLTHLARGLIDGKPLEYRQMHDIAWQILSGGVDTTAMTTAHALVHLARHPGQRRRLVEQPELLPRACEEFVRYFSPIHGAARTIKRDAEINGWRFDKGDRIYLAYSSGNRDPVEFDAPEEIKLDRVPNRHLGFGAGQHRCLGAFMAKMMLKAIIGEFLAHIPDYELIEEQLERYPSIGYVNGIVHAPITFAASSDASGDNRSTS
jgi:cytochrome P450